MKIYHLSLFFSRPSVCGALGHAHAGKSSSNNTLAKSEKSEGINAGRCAL